MRHTLPLLALTTLLMACGGVEVELTTDAMEYRPGDTVQFQLRNQGLQAVGYNLCFVRLERREEGGWVHTAHPGEGDVCVAISHELRAGAHADGSLRLPAEPRAGEYRVAHDVDLQRTDSEGRSVHLPVLSNTFLVGDAP